MLSRPIAIDVPVIAYRPIPDALTAPILAPPRPPLLCELQGVAAVCVLDALATIPAWDAVLQTCNADRLTTRLLGKTDGQ